ncbi:MAG: 50S ribosomal protein L2 [Candidatus Diapherotrites archaeon]
MGKRLISQRRGRGGPTFTATKRAFASATYVIIEGERDRVITGEIIDIMADVGHTSVLAKVEFEDGTSEIIIAAEGLCVGQAIECGKGVTLEIGNMSMVGELVEGCPVFNIENSPGDGGSVARASGMYGIIITKDAKKVYVKMPSGKTVAIKPECRATIGCAAGGGRREKPFVKAGAKHYFMKARKKFYPTVRGVAMNAVDHPFGGSQHHAGKSKSTSRDAPPGRKVGAIASKRTGRRKKN